MGWTVDLSSSSITPNNIYYCYSILCHNNYRLCCPPRWRRGSGLDFGSEDPGSIPGLPSLCAGPLKARRLKTSSDVPVTVSE